jgi:transcriptional regulator with XRE-family HTH domain
MLTFSDRIKNVIEESGCNKTRFAERINISPAYLSQLCSGVRSPSDRTIKDICNEFNISESWLRTGQGDMIIPVSRDDEIKAFLNDLMKAEKPDFRKRMVAVLARLDVKEWQVLEQIARKMVEASAEGKTGLQVIKIAGRDGSFEEHTLTGDEAIALENEIDQLKKPPEDI